MNVFKPELRYASLASKLGRQKAGWICSSCRFSNQQRRGFANAPEVVAKKPYYITTPIFYVNAAPHVGHLYTLVLTDILKRWQLLLGNNDALLLTGTDEHGMKIQRAASAAGVDVRSFCDKNYKQFEMLAERAQVKYDHFIRTTDPAHRNAVEFFWSMLKQRGYIYTSKHEGWYSVSDETFYPQSAVHLTLDPSTGRKLMTSMETGKEVEWTSETNYHFRLSAFQDRLLDFYKENPNFIIPASRMEDVVQSVSTGLQDLSVSRPVERLTWGVRVPGDDSQTIYVWLDALINYLTKAGYPFAPGEESKHGWPADCQVVGKDIVRFHCVYWPAFLMALDISPPRQVLTHAHWTLGREKMSKSTGNVVNPFFAIDRFGPDVMRYYLAHDGGIGQDADYENCYIVERYKKGLQGGLGNLVSRVMRGKSWDVHRSVLRGVRDLLPEEFKEDFRHQGLIQRLPDKVKEKMDHLNPRKALHDIMNVVYETNKYLHNSSPWDLVRAGRHTDADVDRIIYLCAESLRVSGILLQPYLPGKMAQLLDMLGVDEGKRTFDNARFGSDPDYGVPKMELGKGSAGTLFPPIVEG